MDATRGVTNAVLLAVTLAIFNALSKKASDLAGLNGAVIFCVFVWCYSSSICRLAQ